ncbi:hypothetical protein N7516_003338 [Penicillium verrucosum]|uniref:uncharacterized protein n=1 Tax=Penicillium verrucosum TaxID=60171 RepID=UPI00254539E4|nr:uncharacterized protein N7516_003338 [Penicillium verrucosum]KAJ5943170.1 hypothetical protein N7516_003338 [Penicillium verrucosum]
MGIYWSVGVLVKNTEETLLVCLEKTTLLRPNEGITINVQVRKRDATHRIGGKWVVDEGRYAFGLGNGVKNAIETSLELNVEDYT